MDVAREHVTIASRPSYQSRCGGIACRASSRNSAANAATSARSWASMKRRSTDRSSSLGPVACAQSTRHAGSRARIVDRARWSALFTEATLVSSRPAVSLADHPSASRRIKMARCLGGRYWMAARYASSIVSRATTTASGSASLGAAWSSRWSG
jgi:hypothetical protein